MGGDSFACGFFRRVHIKKPNQMNKNNLIKLLVAVFSLTLVFCAALISFGKSFNEAASYALAPFEKIGGYLGGLSSLVSPYSQVAAISGAGSGLVAQYAFNDGAGASAADSSGNANTATLNGGVAWVAGKVGTGAVSLDGTNDYIDAPHSASNSVSGNAVSISAWVYRTNTDLAPHIIAAKVVPGHSPPFFSYSIHLLGGDIPSFWVSTGGGGGEHLQSPVPITANALHHIIGVYDGSTKKIYVDGVEKNSAFRNGNLNTYTSPLRIGANGALGELFKGYIDEVRVFDRALTPSEVTELYTYTEGAPDTQAPTSPTGLALTVISSSQINLSWTASVDNIAVTGYKIYRCTGSSWTPTTLVASPSGVTYSDTGLLASTAYTYAVSAVDAAANESAKSSS